MGPRGPEAWAGFELTLERPVSVLPSFVNRWVVGAVYAWRIADPGLRARRDPRSLIEAIWRCSCLCSDNAPWALWPRSVQGSLFRCFRWICNSSEKWQIHRQLQQAITLSNNTMRRTSCRSWPRSVDVWARYSVLPWNRNADWLRRTWYRGCGPQSRRDTHERAGWLVVICGYNVARCSVFQDLLRPLRTSHATKSSFQLCSRCLGCQSMDYITDL